MRWGKDVCVCALVQVCIWDWEYFMVDQRVNSDRRQMWSHPSKAAWIKNYSNKTMGSGPSSIFLKMTYFRVALKRSQRKPVKRHRCVATPAPHTHTHTLTWCRCWMIISGCTKRNLICKYFTRSFSSAQITASRKRLAPALNTTKPIKHELESLESHKSSAF